MTWYKVGLNYSWSAAAFMEDWISIGSPRMGDIYFLIFMTNRRVKYQRKNIPLMIGTSLLPSILPTNLQEGRNT